jgi:FixJ family two-component response regulator
MAGYGHRRMMVREPRLRFPFLAAMKAGGHPGARGYRRGNRRKEVVMRIRSLVSVIDDDESVRESLPDLPRQFGYAVEPFSSAEEFLTSDSVGQTKCLILDMSLPGMSGPTLQRELTLRRQEIPIVFITAYGDETVRARLLAQGAAECLFKPFSEGGCLRR